jgi:hypothetical protein
MRLNIKYVPILAVALLAGWISCVQARASEYDDLRWQVEQTRRDLSSLDARLSSAQYAAGQAQAQLDAARGNVAAIAAEVQQLRREYSSLTAPGKANPQAAQDLAKRTEEFEKSQPYQSLVAELIDLQNKLDMVAAMATFDAQFSTEYRRADARVWAAYERIFEARKRQPADPAAATQAENELRAAQDELRAIQSEAIGWDPQVAQIEEMLAASESELASLRADFEKQLQGPDVDQPALAQAKARLDQAQARRGAAQDAQRDAAARLEAVGADIARFERDRQMLASVLAEREAQLAACPPPVVVVERPVVVEQPVFVPPPVIYERRVIVERERCYPVRDWRYSTYRDRLREKELDALHDRARAEADARRHAEDRAHREAEAAARARAAADDSRRAADEARQRAQDDARRRSADETRARAAEDARQRAAEDARQRTIDDARRRAAEETRARAAGEAKTRAADEAKARSRAADDARQKALDDARHRAAEEARSRAAAEIKQRALDDARQRAAEDARRRAAEQGRSRAAEEARSRAIEESRSRAAEEARSRAAEEARLRAGDESRQRTDPAKAERQPPIRFKPTADEFLNRKATASPPRSPPKSPPRGRP